MKKSYNSGVKESGCFDIDYGEVISQEEDWGVFLYSKDEWVIS